MALGRGTTGPRKITFSSGPVTISEGSDSSSTSSVAGCASMSTQPKRHSGSARASSSNGSLNSLQTPHHSAQSTTTVPEVIVSCEWELTSGDSSKESRTTGHRAPLSFIKEPSEPLGSQYRAQRHDSCSWSVHLTQHLPRPRAQDHHQCLLRGQYSDRLDSGCLAASPV